MIKTIDYNLKSKPGKSVKVPEEYSDWAGTLVKSAVAGISAEDLDKMIKEDKYLQNYEFFDIVSRLGEMKPGTERSFRLQDIVYLHVCRAYCFDRIGKIDGGEGMKFGLSLGKIIESL